MVGQRGEVLEVEPDARSVAVQEHHGRGVGAAARHSVHRVLGGGAAGDVPDLRLA